MVTFTSSKDLEIALSKAGSIVDGHTIGIFRHKKSGSSQSETPLTVKAAEVITNDAIVDTGRLFIRNLSYSVREIFITRLCKMLCRSHDDQRAGIRGWYK